MDLFAYSQIDNLDKIAKDNGIEVPRLRGYRLMKDEEPVSKKDIEEMMKEGEIYVAKKLCTANPFWSCKSRCYSYDPYTDYLKKYYLIKNLNKDGHEEYIGIRWNRIHGWKRKVLKFAIKKYKRKIKKQYDMWNKYVGREDVLYIHSRIGGGNWNAYGGNELLKQPWFLDKVDDYFDSTYCDIYAKIKVEE